MWSQYPALRLAVLYIPEHSVPINQSRNVPKTKIFSYSAKVLFPWEHVDVQYAVFKIPGKEEQELLLAAQHYLDS